MLSFFFILHELFLNFIFQKNVLTKKCVNKNRFRVNDGAVAKDTALPNQVIMAEFDTSSWVKLGGLRE